MPDRDVLRLIPNLLSAARLIIIPCLFICPPGMRIALLALAVATDFFDGLLARRWHAVSSFGMIIDPIADKALAISFVCLFWPQGLIRISELIAFFSREIALLLFGVYCLASTAQYRKHPFWSGKVASTVQAVIAAFWCYGKPAPALLFVVMALCGIAGLAELISTSRTQKLC